MQHGPRAPGRGALGAALALCLLLSQGFDWPGRAERLVNALTAASTPRDRRDALRLLAELAARTGLPAGLDLSAVVAARSNVDPDVRAEAWSLLAHARPEPEALEEALRDASPTVRLVAVGELVRLDPSHDGLLRSASDPDPTVRAAGVAALALRVEARAAAAPEPGDPARAAAEPEPGDPARAAAAPEPGDPARAAAAPEPGDPARAASERAPGDQARAIAMLASALRDPDLEVRSAALRALGQRSEPEAWTLIASATDDALPELRVAALDALVSSLAHGAAARFADSRADTGANARSASALPGSARAACQRALDDTDQAVVLAGLRCLHFSLARGGNAHLLRAPSRRRAPDALLPAPDPRLVALAGSFSPIVASAARQLLARESEASRPRRVALEPVWLPLLERTADRSLGAAEAASIVDALEALFLAGEALVADPLLEWLPRAPRALRARVVALIERSGATIAAPPVLALLDAAPAPLRTSYVRLLASTRGPETDARLLRSLDDPQPELREAAVFAAARALRSEALPALLDRLADTTGARRRDVLAVLAALLERRLRASPVRQAEQLGARAQETIERRLVRALQRDLQQRDEVCAALAVHALGALSAGLRSRAEGSRAATRARAAVRALLDDARPGRTIAALRASVSDHGSAARQQRRRLLDHHDAGVAATAMVALTLAHDPLPTALALGWLHDAAWPRGPAASFALVHAVATHDASTARFDPCDWLTRDEPITRSNMIAALRRRPSHGCAPRDLAAQRAWLAQQAGWPRHPDEPAALVLEDSSVIVSVPDASGQVGWAELEVAEEVSAFLAADGPP